MNAFKKRMIICVFIVIQIALCTILNFMFFYDTLVYKSASKKDNNQIIIYKDDSQYTLKLVKQGEVIKSEELKSGYRRNLDTAWVGDSYVMFSYVDENYKTVSLQFDFNKANASANNSSLKEAAEQEIAQKKEEEKKLLEKEDKIQTKHGISFDKNSTIAVTYDYGKHWKDTGIDISATTFQNGDLRLSEDSYYLSDEFSYFFYVDYKGWLLYAYTVDAGDTWQRFDPRIAAFDAVWFQSGITENHQPYFFMADKLNKNLIFYQSEDGGSSFKAYESNLEKDINLIYDTSYINDTLLFVTYYEYGDILRSVDHGLTYESIAIDNLDNIHQLKAPTLQNGVLQMIGIDTNRKEVIFTSSDQGLTWVRN